MSFSGRVREVTDVLTTDHSTDVSRLIDRLSLLSLRGLATMYEPRSCSFPHTLREGTGDRPPVTRGMSVRYTAITALGLSRTDPSTARAVLDGQDLPVLVPSMLGLALAGRDPGALALSVWAALEVGAIEGYEVLAPQRERLFRALNRLLEHAYTGAPVPSVEHAWTLVALLAARESPVVAELPGEAKHLAEAADRVARRLLAAQGPTGLFPHHLPPDRLGRLRSHVACFADQAYAIQGLVRYAAATGEAEALEGASRCADRLADLQGDQGQWWWHYDWWKGTVVERYPVYSANQHALAPAALLELWEAGGADHRAAVAQGLGWLVSPPETRADLICDELGVVWRKVGRHEPAKFVRKARSAASASTPGLRLPWLDVVFPPGRVDRECRPFELGWLLYAWQPKGPLVSPDGDLSPELSRMS
jgi:hypothetical protein